MNDIERAINNLKDIKRCEISYGRLWKMCEVSILALEKQIPKKLKCKNFYQGYKCNCSANIPFQMQKYCCECGQKLDWSVEE